MIEKEKLVEFQDVKKAIEHYAPLGANERKVQIEFNKLHELNVGNISFNASVLKNINGEVAQKKALETILKNTNIPKTAIENIFSAFLGWKIKHNPKDKVKELTSDVEA